MHLTLFVPDLLWPDHADRQAFEFEQAGPLARLLFLSKHTATPFSPISSWESVLAETFGLKDQNLPLGAIRLLGEPQSDDNPAVDRTLLCADPVNLNFIQQALVLSSPEASQLDTADVQALLATLNDEFADEGYFFTSGSTKHWYFVPNNANVDLPNLAACSRLLGRRIDADESRQILGRNGLRWLNRVQMCLNDHPVNTARQMQGLQPINSVWPWGTGALSSTAPVTPAPFTQAMGNNALLRGLCTVTKTPYALEMEASQTGLVLDTALAEAIAHDDLDGWQAATKTLIATRLAPALDALTRGELTHLTLISPDAYQTHYWTLSAHQKGLKPTWLQRCLGTDPKIPALATLVSQWSH